MKRKLEHHVGSAKSGQSGQKYPQTEKIQETTIVKKKLVPKNLSQQLYLEALREKTITICTGPAGSGKSYISTYVAIEKLLKKEINKIILTRPVVEAGENLGFLPGTLEEKISPYLRPLLDCIEAHVGVTKMKELVENGLIEFAPLAYLRGRTFNNCVVILDEAQNTTIMQMKMFLTRLGDNCTMIVDGDLFQSDLPRQTNGLQWVYKKLKNIDDSIGVVEFSKKDIVRHPLIEKMITALDEVEPHPVVERCHIEPNSPWPRTPAVNQDDILKNMPAQKSLFEKTTSFFRKNS